MSPHDAVAERLLSFPALLRANKIAVAPDQTQNFVAAVGLLGPRALSDIHAAGRATLAPKPEEFEAYDALFRAHFLGQSLSAPASTVDDERAFDADGGADDTFPPEEMNEAGGEATASELLAGRTFGAMDAANALTALRRGAAGLPHTRARRLKRAADGVRPDLSGVMKAVVRHDGEIITLPRLARRLVQRRIVLLIDVSGSMKADTDRHLRLAHTLVHTASRCEVFTIGTRLTRITRALRHRHAFVALDRAAAAVADWDGGTRLGDALTAFLAVPRFAGFSRSALAVIVSDGLERGAPDALIESVDRLTRLAHRVMWLSPLAADAGYQPQTEAMAAIAQRVDRVGSAGSTAAIVREFLGAARL
ncbi:MAG: VWA domain-containing protein [Pseudomonadota bacterium]